MEAILDFGCGCGRVVRWWAKLDGPRIYGSDYNRTLTDWCRANLPFMTVQTNSENPPLPFEDDAFDLIYALSVFNHLPEEPQRGWMLELRRVLKPGGLLLFTVRGDRFMVLLTPAQQEAYSAGELVVQAPEMAGNNACGAHHPKSYVREDLLPTAGLELVESVHEDRSNGRRPGSVMSMQDNYLARKAPG